jgi:hypothetical protein
MAADTAVLVLLLGFAAGLGLGLGLELSLGEDDTVAGLGGAATGADAGFGDAATTDLLLAAVLPRVNHPVAGVAAAAVAKGPAVAVAQPGLVL